MQTVFNAALANACARLERGAADLARARAELEQRLDDHARALERQGLLTAKDGHLLPRAPRGQHDRHA